MSARAKALYVDLPRCTAKVGDTTLGWRRSQGEAADDKCRQPAKFEIDGRHFCARHAGAAAIKVLMEIE